MERTNRYAELSKIPGVEGWHRNSGRIVVRVVDGTFVTTNMVHPDKLRKEAEHMRFKARVFDALASDMEGPRG